VTGIGIGVGTDIGIGDLGNKPKPMSNTTDNMMKMIIASLSFIISSPFFFTYNTGRNIGSTPCCLHFVQTIGE